MTVSVPLPRFELIISVSLLTMLSWTKELFAHCASGSEYSFAAIMLITDAMNESAVTAKPLRLPSSTAETKTSTSTASKTKAK